MRIFFEAQPALARASTPATAGAQDEGRAERHRPEAPAAEAVCEDILLDAFSR